MADETSTRIVAYCTRLIAVLSDPRPGLASWVVQRNQIATELRNILVGELRPDFIDLVESDELFDIAKETWPGLFETLVSGYEDTEVVKLEDSRVDDFRCADTDEAERMSTIAMIAFIDAYEEYRVQ